MNTIFLVAARLCCELRRAVETGISRRPLEQTADPTEKSHKCPDFENNACEDDLASGASRVVLVLM